MGEGLVTTSSMSLSARRVEGEGVETLLEGGCSKGSKSSNSSQSADKEIIFSKGERDQQMDQQM